MQRMSETYSFSKLTAFDTCPQMWSLTYLDHAPKLKGVFSEYGTLVHSILERYEKGELPLEALSDIFEWEWDQTFKGMKWPPNKYVDLESSYKEKGIAFFQSFPGLQQDEGINILGVEQHFEFPIGDFIMQGYIDLVFEHNGKLVVQDWKTAKKYTKAELAYKVRQPYLYSRWVQDTFGRFPDEIRFHHTKDNVLVVIPFDINKYQEAIDWSESQVEKIRSTWIFPENPDEFFCCNICSVRGSCKCGSGEYWKEQRLTKELHKKFKGGLK